LPDTPLKEVARIIMSHDDIRQVVVVDETAKVCGVISDRLLAQSCGADFDKKVAEDILLPCPATISSGATLREAVALMQRKKIRNLIVVFSEGSRHPRWPLGTVSYADIIQKMVGLALDSHHHPGGEGSHVTANSPEVHRLN
jgi:predicted transcriptional regulator